MPIYPDEPLGEPSRCVIAVDRALPAGRAANAAAVVAFTLGKRHPAELSDLRDRAAKAGLEVVDFPARGQETTDYGHFSALVASVPTEALNYVGVGLYGPRGMMGRLVGKFPLLK